MFLQFLHVAWLRRLTLSLGCELTGDTVVGNRGLWTEAKNASIMFVVFSWDDAARP